MRKKITLAVPFIIMILILIASVLLDVFIAVDLVTDKNSIVVAMISFLTIVFSIWFSYLMIIKQKYSNRIVNSIVRKYVNEGVLLLAIQYLVLLVVGFALLFVPMEITFTVYGFVLTGIIFICYCAKSINKKIGEEEIAKEIDQRVARVLENIEKEHKNNEIKDNLNELNKIYKEAYLNNEKIICEMILDSVDKFFNKFICERNKKIIFDEKNVQESFKIILHFLEKLLVKSPTNYDYDFNLKICSILFNVAKISVKCNIDVVLHEILNSYNHILSENTHIAESLFEDVYRYLFVLEKIALQEKQEDTFECVLEKSKSIYYHVKFEVAIDGQLAFLKHYVLGMIDCVENQDRHHYGRYFDGFKTAVLSEISVENWNSICILISMLLNKSEVIRDKEIKEDIISIVEDLAKFKTIYNPKFFSFINFVVEKLKELEEDERAFEIQYTYAKNIVGSVNDAPDYIFPEFASQMVDEIKDVNKIEELCDKFDTLIMLSIERNKTIWVALLLMESIKCLKNTKQREKQIQLLWIETIQNSLIRVSLSNNKAMQEVVLEYYKKAIQEMDKGKLVSHDLGLKIIESLRFLCESRYRQNEDFVCKIVEFINDLIDSENNYYFVNNSKEVRDAIFRTIYDIGIDAIEKNQELVIKRVSNILGWRIKEMLEKSNSDMVEKLIQYAASLFDLCKENRINYQTIVFVGTLFIIIGAFTTTDRKYFQYRNRIVQALRKDANNIGFLEVSRKLRETEIQTWRDVLGGDPKGAINRFWREYCE